MQVYGITDKGKVRKNNQDFFSIVRCNSKNCYIVALCDGMGGASAGEIASELSNTFFTSYVNSKITSRINKNIDIRKILIDACVDANSLTYDYSLFDKSLNGMGSTLVGGIIYDNGIVHLINVGDSRAYVISKKSNDITQITTDHSLVEEFVSSGYLTKEQAENHPEKNLITRAIGTETTIEADYYTLKLAKNDMLLLCSDGLSNLVSNQDMLTYYFIKDDPSMFCNEMLKLTYDRGAGDNVTIIAAINR